MHSLKETNSTMELHGKKAFFSFVDEEQRGLHHSPAHPSYSEAPATEPDDPGRLSVSRPSSATVVSLSPSSPGGSPWVLSPLCRSPAPSILYHCVASLERRDGNVFAIAVSGGLVFTGSESDRIRVWRQPDCDDGGYIRTHHGCVRAILSHGNTLVTAHKDHRIRVWGVEAASGRLRARKFATIPARGSIFSFNRKKYQQHKDCISCLACNHAEGIIYTGSWDREVKAWKLTEKCCVDSFVAHEGHVNAMLVSQEDGCLFTSSSDGSVKVWRRVFGDSSHALTMTLRFQPSAVNAMAMSFHSSGASYLYSGSSDGYVNVWEKEVSSGRFNHGGFLQGHRFAVLCLAAVGRLVFSGSEDTTIKVWRREEGCGGGVHTCLAVLEGHRGPVRCLAVCVEAEKVAAGLLLYTASLDRMVKVWKVKVMPEDRTKEAEEEDEDEEEDEEEKEDKLEFAMSPVLSPLWVKKKLQRNNSYYS